MLFLLDTTIVSEQMKEHPAVAARLRSLSASDDVATCAIVRGEILYGIERVPAGKRRTDLATKAATVLSALTCLPIQESMADHYARIKQTCEARGAMLNENDLWIAAMAVALQAVLVTRDSDFTRVQSLTVQDWTI